MTFEDRFWLYVERNGPDECWPWKGGLMKGYGKFHISPTQHGVLAHRTAYELLVGPIPQGLVIDHLCRNKRCVNPSHMEPVTSAENTRRGIHKNAKKSECKRGHPYAGDNLIRQRNGWRSCRQCQVDSGRLRARTVA